jgi:hypothetical protein
VLFSRCASLAQTHRTACRDTVLRQFILASRCSRTCIEGPSPAKDPPQSRARRPRVAAARTRAGVSVPIARLDGGLGEYRSWARRTRVSARALPVNIQLNVVSSSRRSQGRWDGVDAADHTGTKHFFVGAVPLKCSALSVVLFEEGRQAKRG